MTLSSVSPVFQATVAARMNPVAQVSERPSVGLAAPLFGARKKEEAGFSSKVWALFLDHYFPDRKRWVVSNYDGDTVSLKGVEKSVRLFGIDAWELKQKYGPMAKEHLGELIGGKKVRMRSPKEGKPIETDRNGRPVAVLEGTRRKGLLRERFNVNLQMVKDGFALAYEDPALTTPEYVAAQEEARKAKRGVWALDPKGGVSPKAYRQGRQ